MPNKPLRPCNKIGCPNLTKNRYCKQHKHLVEQRQRTRRNDKEYDKHKRNQQARAFYHSREWERLRQAALARDHYLCQHCLQHNRITRAVIVDHIVPISVDWSKRLSLDNTQSLCHPCHNRKTAEDRRRYG
ncbi:HNH endonuclease [Saccharococcus caldoxylosilyticus]|uniref:HNH endonuclease n=1 Tax=Saccharococcus caldoxylosilyticus TaxID=81408 RepID=UPI0003720475|nr:HNH endonuclease signature motif containing protein [Parageobacillus caldoxylosilyticus]